jgi:2-dehydro-3-deoxyphosphogluconate aldolase/(4S)-4-hydroxy-2-oxoglutarate aldolase
VRGPLPRLRFCPTGGITAETAPDYLALANVGCVGGSWLTTPDALAARDWNLVRSRAEQARRLGGRQH